MVSSVSLGRDEHSFSHTHAHLALCQLDLFKEFAKDRCELLEHTIYYSAVPAVCSVRHRAARPIDVPTLTGACLGVVYDITTGKSDGINRRTDSRTFAGYE